MNTRIHNQTRNCKLQVPGAKCRVPGVISAFWLMAFWLCGVGWANAATITTDRLDYPPFTDVYVNGSGFGTNETVQMTVETLDTDGTNWTILPGDAENP